MVFAKKKWGQNFLVDNNLLEKIIKTIDIKKDDEILEIGPGMVHYLKKLYKKLKL
ncbi:MAG: hypothetical protein CM15mP33_00240 [Candidatus Neomarinimicrobiota bacterium]|nr:MAG: hypothetical protein CM15mP33_00240 [Candidatus Neomarinimicrobiota bacterium]